MDPKPVNEPNEHYVRLIDRLNKTETPTAAETKAPEISQPKLAPCRRIPREPCPDKQNHFVPKNVNDKGTFVHGDRCDLSMTEVKSLYLDECTIEQHVRLKGIPVESFRPASKLSRECSR
jgi:hypothetical protein